MSQDKVAGTGPDHTGDVHAPEEREIPMAKKLLNQADSLVAKLKLLKSELAEKRDQIDNLLIEYNELLATVDRAEDGLETAICALSDLVRARD